MLSNVKLLFKEYDCSRNVLAANGPSGIGNAISKFSDFCNTLCVTNLVRGLPSNYHKGSPLHHIDSHTGLYFSLSIALMTHTQLIALIAHTQLNAMITQLSPITRSPTSYYTHYKKTHSDSDLVANNCLAFSLC